MRRLMRALHLIHRWMGVVLGPMVVLWLFSGLVMVFVPRPALNTAERLAGLPPLSASDIQISPLEAWRSLGRPGWPQAVRLNTAMTGDDPGRPFYHFLDKGGWFSVRADGGGALTPPTAAAFHQVIPRYAGPSRLLHWVPVERDQWTVTSYHDPWRPFMRAEREDGRHYHVSVRTGEIVLETTRAERAWNWAGTFIHWLYFTELRPHFNLWRGLVLCLSFAACVMVAAGLYLGAERLKISSPYSGGRFSPYRDPWKRLHHWSGLTGGVFLLLWLISGWLSLSPMDWAASTSLSEADRRWMTSVLSDDAALSHRAPLNLLKGKTREVHWTGFDGQPMLLFFEDEHPRRVVFEGDAPRVETSFSLETLAAGVQKLIPQNRLIAAEWLYTPDLYYYPRSHRPFPLPVARLRFDDANESVYYIHPETGGLVAKIDRNGRERRWLYMGLHRLDFPPFDRFETARKIGVIGASLLGTLAALSGCVLGIKRLKRKLNPLKQARDCCKKTAQKNAP